MLSCVLQNIRNVPVTETGKDDVSLQVLEDYTQKQTKQSYRS